MATKRYLAAQVRRTEKHKIVVDAVAVDGIIGITINSKTVQYTCVTGDTTSTAASNLASAIRSAVDGEFQQFQTTVDSTTTNQINIEGNQPGVFITPNGNTALTEVESGGATITASVVQAGKSPADGSDTVNWSGGALPANSGDSVYFEDALFPMWYGADTAFTGKTFDNLYVRPQFVGNGIGMPKFSSAGYPEYHAGRLVLTGCTQLEVDLPDGAGFEAYRFNTGSTACALTVRGQGNGAIGQEAVEWIGANASNTVEVYGGSLRIAPYVGDVATVPSIKIVQGVVSIGSGVTLTTAVLEDATMDLRANCTTLTLSGNAGTSQVVIRDTSAITTLNVRSGQVFHNSSGNITTLDLGPGSSIDFSGSDDAITITNQVTMAIGSRLWDPNGRVTLTAGFKPVNCALSDVTVNNGRSRTYTPS